MKMAVHKRKPVSNGPLQEVVNALVPLLNAWEQTNAQREADATFL